MSTTRISNVRFVDNSDVVLRTLGTNCRNTMRDCCEILVEGVQEKMLYGYHDVHGNPPHTEILETGILFDSIQADITRDSQNAYTVSVGTNEKYARWVHEGTYKLKGRPFITDGVLAKKDEVETKLETGIPIGLK